VVRVRDGVKLRPGDFAEIIVESAGEHDLVARLAA
jgi:bifunctional DNA-binding transcriptional regulator/antitoxin component of YhaV-PrlF toxin-antitoxin module